MFVSIAVERISEGLRGSGTRHFCVDLCAKDKRGLSCKFDYRDCSHCSSENLRAISTQPMEFRIALGDWTTHQSAARLVRDEVFISEQKVPVEEEWDDMDPVCVHAVVYDPSNEVLGTGRLLPDGHIGRMAVRKAARGAGVGAAILKHLMAEAKLRGHKDAVLSAQMHAEPFYSRFGFVREGDEFVDAGIPHIQMRCKLV